ncbi:horcolin-like [Canna indica]|uniref:Horcolin-like n=1 Tax=Canna indica TaxID=4628 RepID=A0AAQ3KD68_9LILI|nr:horcolin-like [Canna indica]
MATGGTWIDVGPMGGNGGNTNDMKVSADRIVKMDFNYDTVVYGFTMTYETHGNQQSKYFGGTKRGRSNKEITLATDEYINSLSGYFSQKYYGHTVIVQLTLTTNKGQKLEIGNPQGSNFTLSMDENGKILGFFGRTGEVLDAIGARCYITY